MNFLTHEVDSIFLFIVSISVFFLLLITFAMIYFTIKFRKEKHPVSENISGNTKLEVLWTLIPLMLVMAMFFYGWHGFKNMREIPPDAMVVKVTGKMWKWSFQYENKKTIDSLLYVPVGRPVKMEIHSADVNHSFYIPAFRIKEDAIPGRVNYLVFNPEQTGSYDIFCAEYCGLNHAYMLGKVIVLPVNEFNDWLNKPDSLKK